MSVCVCVRERSDSVCERGRAHLRVPHALLATHLRDREREGEREKERRERGERERKRERERERER